MDYQRYQEEDKVATDHTCIEPDAVIAIRNTFEPDKNAQGEPSVNVAMILRSISKASVKEVAYLRPVWV